MTIDKEQIKNYYIGTIRDLVKANGGDIHVFDNLIENAIWCEQSQMEVGKPKHRLGIQFTDQERLQDYAYWGWSARGRLFLVRAILETQDMTLLSIAANSADEISDIIISIAMEIEDREKIKLGDFDD